MGKGSGGERGEVRMGGRGDLFRERGEGRKGEEGCAGWVRGDGRGGAGCGLRRWRWRVVLRESKAAPRRERGEG